MFFIKRCKIFYAENRWALYEKVFKLSQFSSACSIASLFLNILTKLYIFILRFSKIIAVFAAISFIDQSSKYSTSFLILRVVKITMKRALFFFFFQTDFKKCKLIVGFFMFYVFANMRVFVDPSINLILCTNVLTICSRPIEIEIIARAMTEYIRRCSSSDRTKTSIGQNPLANTSLTDVYIVKPFQRVFFRL